MPTTIASLNGIVINEVHASPSGPAQDLNGDFFGDGDDEFIELYNTSGSFSAPNGFEIWIDGNLVHTFDPVALAMGPGGRFTIVDGSNPLSLSGFLGFAEFSDSGFGIVNSSTVILYDPGIGGYIMVAGIDAGDFSNPASFASGDRDAFLFAHPSAVQVGPLETLAQMTSGDSAQRDPDGDDTWVTFEATPGEVNMCFATGTLIATPEGETPVEALRIGDLVTTADGRDVPVRWVGVQTIQKRFAGARAQMVRIAAGVLGNHSDLFVTGDHGMVLDGFVVNASALVGVPGIDWVPLSETPERFTVYHVETEGHDVILANGAAAETFVDYAGRQRFDNHAEFVALYGDERVIAENPLPRVSATRHLPPGVRRRLAEGSMILIG